VDVEQALNPVAGMTADLSEQLLRAIASALDIRQVFPQVSAIAKEMLPHDRLTMTLHDGQQTCIAHAVSNDDGPLLVRVSGARIADMVEGSSRIIDDLALDTPEATFEPPDYREKVKAAGYRSALSVALAAGEQRFGLHFWSKRVRAFDATMVPVARHIAVYVAMGFSHERLAETARQAAAARADADRLTARVRRRGSSRSTRATAGWRDSRCRGERWSGRRRKWPRPTRRCC
jgi:hypothetical protein